MAKCNRLFTYGTLMQGQRLHGCLNGAEWVGDGCIAGQMQTNGIYPVAIPAPGIIHGEMYTIPNAETWARLDQVERGYKRRITTVISEGKVIPCFVYWYTGTYRGEIITSGDWREHQAAKSIKTKGESHGAR
jgi:gamma-glutamylcyclotransferase (GGCT)/AIG2-like uncharacterized protein YtfP